MVEAEVSTEEKARSHNHSFVRTRLLHLPLYLPLSHYHLSPSTSIPRLLFAPRFALPSLLLQNLSLLYWKITMYRSPSRGNRSRGFKVKHILQICLLVAVCFWLIYQVKHSHEKKKEFEEKDAKLVSDAQSGNENIRLGRKDISRVTETGTEDKLNGEDDEENETDQAENKHEDDEQETEETRTVDVEDEEDARKGGEEDEIEKGEEKHEEDEIVDEEKDREESDEKREDIDVGEKEDNEESEALLDDQDHEGEGRNTQQEREEHYKADDASSEVAHDTKSFVSDAENATLKHGNGEPELIMDGKENVSRSSNQSLLQEITLQSTNSSDLTVPESTEHKDNVTVPVYSSSENSTDLAKLSDHAQVANNMTEHESELSTNTTQAQNTTSEDIHNESSNPTLSLISLTNTSDSALTNSSEIVNNTAGEFLNSSSDEKLGVANNVTGSTEIKVDDDKSADTGNLDNPESNTEINVTGSEDDNVGADPHEHGDDFASSLTQEEKENRIDPGTLPDIDVEVQSTDEIEAE